MSECPLHLSKHPPAWYLCPASLHCEVHCSVAVFQCFSVSVLKYWSVALRTETLQFSMMHGVHCSTDDAHWGHFWNFLPFGGNIVVCPTKPDGKISNSGLVKCQSALCICHSIHQLDISVLLHCFVKFIAVFQCWSVAVFQCFSVSVFQCWCVEV